jgi:DUF1680 family protein
MGFLSSQRDRIRRPAPDATRMSGLIGTRFVLNDENRLKPQDPFFYLWPFQEHCPIGWRQRGAPHPEITVGDWHGEFLGPWIETAVLTAWNLDDRTMRAKLDEMVDAWLAMQAPDGYLGTYDEADRWESWDVWVQAHNLIGLLRYFEFTGREAARQAAVRVAQRVMADFGPGRRYLHVGPHNGMAASAILEPMMWLYRHTGDQQYLDFGLWLVDNDWEAPGGPAIVSSLLAGRGVANVANGKAAEMLISLTGLAELYAVTGNETYLQAIQLAWEDIVAHHLYITGSPPPPEYFQKDFVLRNDGPYLVGETCVTMTWMYLNLALGRLTGAGRFFDQAEQAVYNHLLAAQSPDGRGWAYYTGLRDHKRYREHTDPDCCPVRGMRALAHLPQHVVGLTSRGVAVNFYESAEAVLALPDDQPVSLSLITRYPFEPSARLVLRPAQPARFTLSLRRPGWCQSWRVTIQGRAVDPSPAADGYLAIEREWSPGDEVQIRFEMPPHVVADRLGNHGRAAIMRGPVVYAADTAYLPAGWQLDDVSLWLDRSDPAQGLRIEPAPLEPAGARVWVSAARNIVPVGDASTAPTSRYTALDGQPVQLEVSELALVPFFAAGTSDPESFQPGVWLNDERPKSITYQVWLPYAWHAGSRQVG